MSDHYRALRESPTPFLLGCGTVILLACAGLAVLVFKVDDRKFLPAMAGSLIGVALLFTTALAIYDAVVWYFLKARCEEAIRAPTVEARAAALEKATWRRRDPLLLIPPICLISTPSRGAGTPQSKWMGSGAAPAHAGCSRRCPAPAARRCGPKREREMACCVHPACVGHLACGDTYWRY